MDHETFLRYARRPQQFKEDVLFKLKHEHISHCFVDEIQKLPGLLDVVQDLIQSSACVFVLSGSSARKLRRSGVNLLAGRALQYHLFPFVYAEIPDAFDLNTVLQFGSLPPVHVAPTLAHKIKILQTYVETYLKEEIQAEGLVRNLGGFGRFLEVAAGQCGDILVYQNVGQACQVEAKTVQGYYEILQDTLIGLRHEPWRKSLKKRLVAHAKFYLFDTGVTNALNHRLTDVIDPQTRGRLFEQLMILECYRQLNYLGSEARLFYWRTEHGAEVDLIIEKHGAIRAAIEFKSVPELRPRDFYGLKSFALEHPEVPRYLVYTGTQAYQATHAQVWPYKLYLETIPTLL